MADFIVIAVVVALVGAAVLYIRREKKKGVKCIGCPDGAACGSQGGCAGCGGGCGGSCHIDADS